MSLSLASILSESARRHPGRTALVFGPERVTYRDLWDQARRYSAVFARRGIGPGDRVAILIPNLPDFPRTYFAIMALGAVVVPVHALLTAEEVAYVLADSGAKLLVCAGALLAAGAAGARKAGVPCLAVASTGAGSADGDLPAESTGMEPLAAIVPREAEDDAVILYTSGTTGVPKGAILTHGNIMWNAYVTAHDLQRATPQDTFLGALPLFHCFGQVVVMNCAFLVGASVALMARFDGDAALELMEDERVTIFCGVPTM